MEDSIVDRGLPYTTSPVPEFNTSSVDNTNKKLATLLLSIRIKLLPRTPFRQIEKFSRSASVTLPQPKHYPVDSHIWLVFILETKQLKSTIAFKYIARRMLTHYEFKPSDHSAR